jgi:hypothetical protein
LLEKIVVNFLVLKFDSEDQQEVIELLLSCICRTFFSSKVDSERLEVLMNDGLFVVIMNLLKLFFKQKKVWKVSVVVIFLVVKILLGVALDGSIRNIGMEKNKYNDKYKELDVLVTLNQIYNYVKKMEESSSSSSFSQLDEDYISSLLDIIPLTICLFHRGEAIPPSVVPHLHMVKSLIVVENENNGAFDVGSWAWMAWNGLLDPQAAIEKEKKK